MFISWLVIIVIYGIIVGLSEVNSLFFFLLIPFLLIDMSYGNLKRDVDKVNNEVNDVCEMLYMSGKESDGEDTKKY